MYVCLLTPAYNFSQEITDVCMNVCALTGNLTGRVSQRDDSGARIRDFINIVMLAKSSMIVGSSTNVPAPERETLLLFFKEGDLNEAERFLKHAYVC